MSHSNFPLQIQLIDNGEVRIVHHSDDLPVGRAFVIWETKVKYHRTA